MSGGRTPKYSGKGAERMCAERTSAGDDAPVRLCEPADLVAILEILAQAPGPASWSAAGLEEALQLHGKYFLVSGKADELAGFVLGRRMSDEGEILNLAVKPRDRRRGLGKALVQRLLEIFEEDGVSTVFLEVRESNCAAIALYRELGFRQVGARPSYYRDPAEAALILRFNFCAHTQSKGPAKQVT